MATKFTRVTAVNDAEDLILRLRSLDQFCIIFQHTSYIDFKASDDSVLAWSKYLWRDLGAKTLLSELILRKHDLALVHNDKFDYTHECIVSRYDQYLKSSQLRAIRLVPQIVKIIEPKCQGQCVWDKWQGVGP
ncbi:hypothetical protein E4U50_005747 [Claviceps purpurea]|nr:hypothetical protein E4U50_005747 [Claviceps purpurea]